MHLTERKRWSSKEIEILKILYEKDGLCAEEIAPLMSRSLCSIHLKRKRLKLRHTTNQTCGAKSRINSGSGNAMYGKKSWSNGLSKNTDNRLRNAAQAVSNTRKRMFKEGLLPSPAGQLNPMYGKPSWSRGLTKETSEKIKSMAVKISIHKKNEWKSMSESEKEAKIKFLTKICYERLRNKKTRTSIEVKTEEFLNQIKVRYEPNFQIGRFLVDFYLPQSNLVIECQGDYWHANPLVYKSELDKIQLKNIDRDNRKKLLLAAKGIKSLFFWEMQINNNFSEVKDKIMAYCLPNT